MNPHYRPTAAIAPRAILPGDPARALALAQELLDRPLMCNHHRGLWGYTGTTAAGHELTIQSTGLGGSSAAIVLAELARHGVRSAIRIGTCTALESAPPLGAAVAASSAVGLEGSSRALGADRRVDPDPDLHRALVAAAGGGATQEAIASVDIPPHAAAAGGAGLPAGIDGARVVDMGTATLFALGAGIGVAVAGALVVSHTRPGAEALNDEALEEASLRVAEAAVQALGC